MKVCPKCEYENSDESAYCQMCGEELTSIEFLKNASQGKNNWWRYLITIGATWGVQIFLGFIIGILLVIYILMQGFPVTSYNEYINNPFFILLLTLFGFMASYIALYAGMRFIHKRKFISFITTKSKINWMRVLKGAGIWFAILGAYTLITYLIAPEGYKFTFNSSTFGIFFIISLITFPIQASFEELFFRGYLMQGFGVLFKKPIFPLLATSIIFGLVHVMNGANMTFSIFPAIEASIIGLMLGIITLGEDSIETATGIHIINNLYVALIVSTEGSVIGNVPSVLTVPADPSGSIFLTVIISVIAIAIIFWGKMDRLKAVLR